MDMMQLTERFHSEEKCREVLAELRWPEGIRCPRCEGERHAYDSERFVWDCYSCGYQFSALAGTIFHDTKLPIRKWFMAILLMVEAKKGMSANQMKRTLGVSYKTAWYLCHRIRAAMKDDSPTLLKGIVEVDETFIGGKTRRKGRGYRGNKTTVVGAIERGGDIRMRVAPNTTKRTLHAFIKQNVDGTAEAIFTDSWPAYMGIGDHDTRHETVDHHIEEWVRADVHTQSIESVWSLLKRSVVGSYHQLSAKHLNAYLQEITWRYNNRHNDYLFRDTLTKLLKSENLEYKELIA
jgi:transposase-like protein